MEGLEATASYFANFTFYKSIMFYILVFKTITYIILCLWGSKRDKYNAKIYIEEMEL